MSKVKINSDSGQPVKLNSGSGNPVSINSTDPVDPVGGNLVLNKSAGGQVGYDVPPLYTFDINTLLADEIAGTITKVGESFPAASVPYPAGFTYQPFAISRNEAGTYSPFANRAAFRTAYMPVFAGTTYYAAPSIHGGSAANSGLSMAAPLTVAAALAKTDIKEIILMGDGVIYPSNEFISSSTVGINKNIVLRTQSGTAYMGSVGLVNAGNHLDATATPDVYFSEFLAVGGFIELGHVDEYGYPIPYTVVATEAEMLAQERTTWRNVGVGQYVHVPAGYIPVVNSNCIPVGANLYPLVGDYNVATNPDLTFYFEGIFFVGTFVTVLGTNSNLYTNNCAFVTNRETAAFAVNLGSTSECGSFETFAGYCGKDAFSYHDGGNTFEIRCISKKANLFNSNTSNQNSTNHDGGKVIRIDSIYDGSQWNIVEINNNTYSLNIGCTCKNANATGTVANIGGVEAGCKIWLIDFTTEGTGSNTIASSGGEVYLQGYVGDYSKINANYISPAGTIKYFGLTE